MKGNNISNMKIPKRKDGWYKVIWAIVKFIFKSYSPAIYLIFLIFSDSSPSNYIKYFINIGLILIALYLSIDKTLKDHPFSLYGMHSMKNSIIVVSMSLIILTAVAFIIIFSNNKTNLEQFLVVEYFFIVFPLIFLGVYIRSYMIDSKILKNAREANLNKNQRKKIKFLLKNNEEYIKDEKLGDLKDDIENTFNISALERIRKELNSNNHNN